MLTDKLEVTLSPVIFFISSLGITYTGRNTIVVASGAALSLAGVTCIFANHIHGFGAKYRRLMPAFALCANVPLTINSIFMVQGGIASGQSGLTTTK